MSNSLAAIESFLAQPRIAFFGLSTHPEDFSHEIRKVLQLLPERELVAINPHAEQPIAELETHHHLAEAERPVDAALIMTAPEHSAEAMRECLDAGVGKVWLYRGVGQGAVTPEAVALAKQAGVELVEGECPLMFLGEPKPGFVHRAHGWFRKVGGSYPE